MIDWVIAPTLPARLRRAVVLALVLAFGPPAWAQPNRRRLSVRPSSPPGLFGRRCRLSKGPRSAPLQNDWASIDGPRKSKWLDIAARYPKLPPSEQERLQARMSEWARMTPSERARARLNYQEVKQLPQQERQDRWQAYQALPEDQRQALATRSSADTQPKAPKPGHKPPPEASVKRNIVPNPSLSSDGPTRPVAPTVVQASPGATTTLVTRQPTPPAHQQAGMPKIAATPGFVDRNTLLPKRGPQGAGVRPAASAPAARP